MDDLLDPVRKTFNQWRLHILAENNQRGQFLCLCFALTGIWALLNLPLLLGLKVLPWDAIDEFYPTVYFNAHSLRHGIAPWWNPYLYSGYPQIADPQGMLFSPLLMAWMMSPNDPGASWFTWGVLLHLLMGGLGMLALLRRDNVTPFGALIGSTVFMAGGVAASRIEHTPIVLAYCYVPWVWLALRRFINTPNWQRGLSLGLVSGCLLTHLTQVTYLFVIAIAVYAAIATVSRWKTYDPLMRLRWFSGAVIALAVTLLIGLPQLILSWAFVTLSTRAILPISAALPSSLPLADFSTLFLPNALHALRGNSPDGSVNVEGYFYIGALPLVLLYGLVSAWRSGAHRKEMYFFGALLALSVLYSMGLHTPVYGWLYAWLPGIKQFRRPSDAAYLVNFCVAVGVGLAASYIRFNSRRQISVLLIISASLLAIASADMRGASAHWQPATLAAALFALFVLWRLQRSGSDLRTAIWLLLLLVVDYRCFNLNGRFNESPNLADKFIHEPAADFLSQRLAYSPAGLAPRIETIDATNLWDNYVLLRGISSTQGYNPLRYALYDRWYGARDNGSLPRIETPTNHSIDSRLSQLLSVQYLVLGHTYSTRSLGGYTKVFTGKAVDVWLAPHVYPRILTPTQAIIFSGDPSVAADVFPATDFSKKLLLTPTETHHAQELSAMAATCNSELQIETASFEPAALSVQTSGDSAGWLVLSELDFPGWLADIDGATSPIYRANGMFRAVCIPAGNHTMHMVFHPWAMVTEAWKQASTH